MSRRVTFDRSLYLPEAVDAAAEAYAQHATIVVKPAPDGVMAVISGTTEVDLNTVVNAFCNHVLYETIVRLRQSALQEARQ
jgi:hypothetical protein